MISETKTLAEGATSRRALALAVVLSGLTLSAISPVMAMTARDAAQSGNASSDGTGDAGAALQQVIDDEWALMMRTSPEFATSLGDHSGDGKISDQSLEFADSQIPVMQQLVDRLNAIPDDRLTRAQRTNKAILLRQLRESIRSNSFGQRMIYFSSYSSWHQNFAALADISPFATRADYESYLARLAQYPAYNEQGIVVTRRAIAEGYVQPCVAMGEFEKSITGVIAANPEQSRFYTPFLRPRPQDVTPAQWTAMQARAKTLITGTLNPEYQRLATFYHNDYAPKCRQTIGASALPNGAQWYAEQARNHTTTDLTPAQIHQIGLDEVKRITARMDAVARQAGFPSRAAYIAHLKTDPQYHVQTAGALIGESASVAKQIDGLLPRYFGKLPRLTFTIKPVPAETAEGTTAAYYMPGSMAAHNPGTFYINTSKLNERPTYVLPALTAHEAIPGHHFQLALQQEIDFPKFRQYATYFTAYGEGWGLYSEYLGEEMGLYDTPAKMMGRLSFEAWRAARLVVDTGIHAMGWSKEQAKAFMRENSAEPEANIEAEVNRYITWPGQALGYKIGELRIRALREKATKALGDRFDLAGFHDAVLSQGSVPLDVLDSIVDDWIASVKTGGTKDPQAAP